MIPILGDLIHEVGETVRKVIPDADKRLDIDLALAQLADQTEARETQLLASQVDVNKAEASSGNIFVAGWRPFIGWVCGSTLAYTWILAPVAKTVFHLSELPVVPTDQIYPIVLAMLGVAIPRTVEKIAGVATGQLGKTVPVAAPPQSTDQPKSLVSKIGSFFR